LGQVVAVAVVDIVAVGEFVAIVKAVGLGWRTIQL
jgi:hypothetical protein